MWRFLRHTTRLLRHQGYYKQGYYIKMYQGYYVTMTLTNHRTFQNQPALDAKMHFCSSESRESRIFGISALKSIVLKNKTKLFFDMQLINYHFLVYCSVVRAGLDPGRDLTLTGQRPRRWVAGWTDRAGRWPGLDLDLVWIRLFRPVRAIAEPWDEGDGFEWAKMAVDRVTWQWLFGIPAPALCRGRLPSHWRPPLLGGGSRAATYPVADSHQARVNDGRTEERGTVI